MSGEVASKLGSQLHAQGTDFALVEDCTDCVLRIASDDSIDGQFSYKFPVHKLTFGKVVGLLCFPASSQKTGLWISIRMILNLGRCAHSCKASQDNYHTGDKHD